MSQRHGGGDLIHMVRMYRTFSSRLLSKGNAVAFAFDTNEDKKPDRLVAVFGFVEHYVVLWSMAKAT